MKVKHELQLLNTFKQLLAKQENNVIQQNKLNEKFETQQILFSKKLEDLQKKNIELDSKLDRAEKTNVKLVEKIGYLGKKLELVEKHNCELVEKIESQNAVLANQIKQIQSTEEKMELLEKKLDEIEKSTNKGFQRSKQEIENQLKDYENKIEALTLFSNDLSRLHLTIGHWYIQRNYQQYFIFSEGEYSKCNFGETKRIEETTWNTFTKEIAERDKRFDGCDFLRNLKEAITNYSKSVYPKKHYDRYGLCIMNKFNDLWNNNLKIKCSLVSRYISFKICQTIDMFDKELQTKKYLVRHNDRVASYDDYVNDCLHIVVFHDQIKRVLLIHPDDENKITIVPNDGTRSYIGKGWNKYEFYLFYLVHY